MAKLALVEKGIEEKYKCSNNLFRSNLRFNVDPNAALLLLHVLDIYI